MRVQHINTFGDGVKADFYTTNSPNTALTHCINGRFVSFQGNDLILQNIKGLTDKGIGPSSTTAGSYGGIKVFKDVAYIISLVPITLEVDPLDYLETDLSITQIADDTSITNDLIPLLEYPEGTDDVLTFSLEIGTFPSPNWDSPTPTGVLVDEYKPLKNLIRLDDFDTAYLTDFTGIVTEDYTDNLGNPLTSQLAVDFTRLEVELQPEFDGSVNIIFTDGVNPVRMVNSGFSVTSRNYEIKTSINDTPVGVELERYSTYNTYFIDDIETRASLILKNRQTPTLIKEDDVVLDILDNSSLKCGTYQFFFKYANSFTQEGDVEEFTRKISLWKGSAFGNAEAGTNEDDANATVGITLSNVNKGFDNLFVYYSYTYSNEDTARTTVIYRITTPYSLDTLTKVGDTYDYSVTITGLESIEEVTSTDILSEFTAASSFKTLTQAKNRLFAANPTYAVNDWSLFKDVTSKITVGQKREVISIPGIGSTNPLLLNDYATFHFSTQYSSSSDTDLNNSFDTYYNPQVLYNKTGYMGGETYTFGIVFILNDNTNSPVFPVYGIDKLESTINYNFSPYDEQFNTVDLASIGSNGFNPTTANNVKGVYRFTKRNYADNDDQNSGIVKYVDNTTPTKFIQDGNIFCSYFIMPEEIYEETSDVRSNSKGFFFVRATRNANKLDSGLMTQSTVLKDGMPDDYDMDDTTDNASAFSVLSVAGFHEGVSYNATTEEADSLGGFIHKDSETVSNSLGHASLLCASASLQPDKAANMFRNTDISINKVAYLPTGTDILTGISSELIGDFPTNPVTSPYLFPLRYDQYLESFDHYNVIATAAYVEGALPVSNSLGYVGSMANTGGHTLIKRTDGVDSLSAKMSLDYCNYIGLKGDDLLSTPTGVTGFRDRFFVNPQLTTSEYHVGGAVPLTTISATDYKKYVPELMGYYVDVYSKSGIWTKDEVIKRHSNTDQLLYQPISVKFLWEDVDTWSDSELVIDGTTTDAKASPNVYGGDTVIASIFHKVQKQNQNPGSIAGDEGINYLDVFPSNKVGLAVSYAAETDILAFLRRPYSGSAEELATFKGKRDFVPRLTVDDASYSRVRDYSTTPVETTKTNDAFLDPSSSIKAFSALTSLSDNQRTDYTTRINFSDIAVSNSFINGYRDLQAQNYQDYPVYMGGISKIITYRDNIISVFEQGIASIPVDQRIQTGSDAAGGIFVKPEDVLSSQLGIISDTIGSQYRPSVIRTDTSVVGIDFVREKIWLFNGQLNLISEVSVSSFFTAIKEIYAGVSPTISDIITLYDNSKKEILFFFRGFGCIVYSEKLGVWNGIYSSDDYNEINNGFTVSNTNHLLFRTETNIFAEDNDLFVKADNTSNEFEIEFICSKDITMHQIYDNLKIISNEIMPTELKFTTAKGYYKMTPADIKTVGQLRGNSRYKENHWYLTPIILQFSEDDITYGDPVGDRIRDKAIRVNIKYDFTDVTLQEQTIYINYIISSLRASYS